MAEEATIIAQEPNGEEVSEPKVNGLQLQDNKEVTHYAEPTDSAGVSAEPHPRLMEVEEVTDSPIRLRLEDSPSAEKPAQSPESDSTSDTATQPRTQSTNGDAHNSHAALPETPSGKGLKRKSSSASTSDEETELVGFDTPPDQSPSIQMNQIVDKLEKEIMEAEQWRRRKGRPPAKRPHLASPTHTSDTHSRPSSGLSLRSESDLMGGNGSSTEMGSSAANSPNPSVGRGVRKASVDLGSPLYREPLDRGWRRELVYRAALDQHSRRQGDIYYYSPSGKKLRSTREVAEHLVGTGLSIDNFTFFKEPLGLDDPEKEIIRDAKAMRMRTESPVGAAAAAAVVAAVAVDKPAPASAGAGAGLLREGKRTPKPKGAKGASPERGSSASSSPRLTAPFKVKSVGSRLSAGPTGSPPSKVVAKDTPKARAGRKSMPANQWKKPMADLYYTLQQPDTPRYTATYPPATGANSPKSGVEPCSMRCPLAQGEVPSLQCSVCLCLYHEKCAGLRSANVAHYICKNCHSGTVAQPSPPPLTHVSTLRAAARLSPPASAPPALTRCPPKVPTPRLVPVVTRVPLRPSAPRLVRPARPVRNTRSTMDNKGIVGSVTSWLPPASSIQMQSKKPMLHPNMPTDVGNLIRIPQSIAVINGKRFIIVPKHNVLSVSTALPGQAGSPVPKQAENAPKLGELDVTDRAKSDSPVATRVRSSSDDDVKERATSDYYPDFKNTILKQQEVTVAEDCGISGDEEDSKESMEDRGIKRSLSDVEDSPSNKKRAKAVTPKLAKITKVGENGSPASRGRPSKAGVEDKNYFAEFYRINKERGYNSHVQIFQYLKMRELASAARVCRMMREITDTPALWKFVRMKNSQVNDWQGLAAALKRHGTRYLDLRKMLLPAEVPDSVWEQFSCHIPSVDTLLRIDLCRCPASVVEAVARGLPGLQVLTAPNIRCPCLDLAPLANLTQLEELRIKSMTNLTLNASLHSLRNLTKLRHLSITSVKDLSPRSFEAVAGLEALTWLELGECVGGGAAAARAVGTLHGLTRLRLERSGPDDGGPSSLLLAAASLPNLTHLELVNFEIRAGFEEALAMCTRVKRLLIIPMYVSQSATTNRCVLDGVLRLRSTLTHLVWGVTIELLRVTELFIDQERKRLETLGARGAGGVTSPTFSQCDRTMDSRTEKDKALDKADRKKANVGECIPVLKPVPGLMASLRLPVQLSGPPQVEILPLGALQRLLNTELPDTRLRILRIPYHATWRQALTDID